MWGKSFKEFPAAHQKQPKMTDFWEKDQKMFNFILLLLYKNLKQEMKANKKILILLIQG